MIFGERKIYFNIWNGRVGNPTLIPAYYAVVRYGVVKEIHLCFLKSKIEKNGKEWVTEMLDRESRLWSYNEKLLMKTLRQFANNPKFWFVNTNFDTSGLENYTYIRWR